MILRLTVFLMLVLSLNLNAQSAEELFKQANEYYRQQNYDRSIEIYNEILNAGYESPELYYNLGNAYFKSGKIGYAILYYEKGLKLKPGDEDLEYNLRIARARTVDKVEEVPRIFLVEWWDAIVTSLSLDGWAAVVIVVYLIFIASLGGYFLSKKIKIQKISFFSASFALPILIVLSLILYTRYNREVSMHYGILVENVYSVKVAPDDNSNDAFVVHEGLKMELIDKVGEWVKIKLPDGKVGWVERNVVRQI
ncbi:tetratricopeptide repeat protein [Melioribacter sp. OK-6-Me]|uniref:tetratricopeptide repeat protein n=1 Tax=unclassified Melioribacter TaxID=2627329 RepID=UPI003ED8A7B7